MYAIIATGGKQYRVSEGDVIYIEKIDAQVDSTVSFDVLLMGNDGDVKIGTPVVEGVKVEGQGRRPDPRREDRRLQVQVQEELSQ